MFNCESNKSLNCEIYYLPSKAVSEKIISNKKIKQLYESVKTRDKLLYLVTYKISDAALKNEIVEFLTTNYKSTDIIIYSSIKKILKDYKIEEEPNRGEFRINAIKKYISNWEAIAPTFYLDIGCFDGEITRALGKFFNLNKFQIHGIDIKEYNKPTDEVNSSENEYIFTPYDGITIPYDGESFDLITCFMVLHHVPEKNITTLLKEIYRIMKSGGILILREHNAQNDKDFKLLDVLHEYYDYVLNSTNVWEESHGNYNNMQFWTSRLEDAGFIEYNNSQSKLNNPFNQKNPKNPFKNYMTSFVKS
jgi:ubiquinone/menaquinone biosynthesis C-methylase UbiE